MKEFIEYIDKNAPDDKNTKILFKFKRDLLTQMNERYIEVSGRGISNEKVFSDLVISEHRDLDKEYAEYYKKATASSRRKKMILGNVLGSVIFILLALVAFLAVGFKTQDWGHCWVIIVDSILLWITYLLGLGVVGISKLKRIFHIFARILLALAIVTFSVAVFIFCLALTSFGGKAWLIVIFGVIAMFVGDLIYISVRKQKLAVINYLIYIPVICTMLFVILCAIGLFPWSVGWLLVPGGLLIDLIIVIGELIETKHFEKEMMHSWKEN